MARKVSSQSEAIANVGFEAKLWLAAESERSVDSQSQIARWASEARQYKHAVLSLSRSEIFIYGQDKWVRGPRPFGLAKRACRVRLRGQQPKQSNATTRRLAIMNLAIRGIEADFGPEHADTFRRDLHPDLRADYVLATAMRDSTLLNAKPYCRACRRQDNPMPFNDSDTALRGSAFPQSEAKPQVVSETKDNFRKDDDVRWQPSGAGQIAKGNPQGQRGGVHQFGVPPKGNANFAWVQHFIHRLAPNGSFRIITPATRRLN